MDLSFWWTIFIDISRKQSINRYNWLYLLGVINIILPDLIQVLKLKNNNFAPWSRQEKVRRQVQGKSGHRGPQRARDTKWIRSKVWAVTSDDQPEENGANLFFGIKKFIDNYNSLCGIYSQKNERDMYIYSQTGSGMSPMVSRYPKIFYSFPVPLVRTIKQ